MFEHEFLQRNFHANFFLHDQTILYSFYKYNGQAILGMLRIFCLALEELLHNFAHDYCFYEFQL